MNLVHVPCPLCGADDSLVRFPSRGSSGFTSEHLMCTSPKLGHHGPIVECRRCGMVYANPQPAPQDLAGGYAKVEDPSYVEEEEGRVATFAGDLARLHRHVVPPGNLLDAGCYTGVFLAVAAAAGWTTTGLELSHWAAAHARTRNVGAIHESSLEATDLPAGSFDVVTLWDVIEHLPSPRRCLAQIRRLLRSGGTLALSTHLLDRRLPRLMGSRYPFLMDMHLVHFTQQTLRRTLDQEGFDLLEVATHRREVHLSYLFERLGRLMPAGGALVRRFPARLGLAQVLVGITCLGLVDVIARRRA